MTADLSKEQCEKLELAQARAAAARIMEDPRKTALRNEAQHAADRTGKFHYLWGWEYRGDQPITYCFDLKQPQTVPYETIRPVKVRQ